MAYALRKNVMLVAPAGDDAQGAGLVNYPAAYPGVIAVGAVGRDGQVAPFSSRHSYVSLTAPGVALIAATPPHDYTRISSTSTSSGIVAGVAALILSRYPHLTVAQVTRALTRDDHGASPAGPAPRAPGTAPSTPPGRSTWPPRSSRRPSRASRPGPRPDRPGRKPEHLPTTAAHQASASTLAGSLVRYIVAGLAGLIVLLVVLLLVMRSRRERARAAAKASGRVHPGPVPGAARAPQAGTRARPGQVAAGPGGLTGLTLPPARLGWPPPGPADDHRRLARRRGLAGRQHGRDRALLRRAVPPGHDAGAEGRQDGQGGREPRGAALGARAGARAHDRAAPGGGEQRAARRIRVLASGCPGTWRRWPPWRPTPRRPRPSTSRRRRTRTSRRGPPSVTTRPGLPRPAEPSGQAEPRLRRGPGPGRLRAAPGP